MNNEKNEIVEALPSVTISKIKFNNNTELPLNNDDIVIFVGANNVGKSRALKDIKDDIVNSSLNKIIINEIQYSDLNFTEDNMKNYFEKNFTLNEVGSYDVTIDNNYGDCYNEYNFKNISSEKENFYKAFLSFLSTANRLNMTSPISFSNITDRLSFNIMRKLEKDKSSIMRLNNILLSCFDRAIDVSEGEYQGSVSKVYKFGTKAEISRTINTDTREARNLLDSLENLSEQGDGIRSAVAIIASFIANDYSLYLIDEPETFLHPPQAKILGNNLVELSESKQCFISTHNIDLIRGILERESSRIKIIKINRNQNENEFHILDNDSIRTIANDKNLKYSNILNGLFYNTVVLCENESDCKFYSGILESVDSNIYQNTLFCAVGGKDQFKIIIPLLKKLQINYLVIADLDLINNKGKLKDLLNSISEEKYKQLEQSHNEFLTLFEKGVDDQIKKQSQIKEEISQLFTSDTYMSDETAIKIKNKLKNISHLKLLKNNGKACLPPGPCVNKYNEIIDFLNSNNIFVVECGEIERFIPEVEGHGNAWVDEVFNRYPLLEEEEYSNVKTFIKTIFKIK